mgnify:CR=1 FL=1
MAVAVSLGALGAHFLKSKAAEGILTFENVASFQTAVKYQVFHSLGILLLFGFAESLGLKKLKIVASCFVIGIILFSGSIYFLSTKTLLGVSSLKWLGPVTPLGGVSFIIGWLMLAIYFIKSKSREAV